MNITGTQSYLSHCAPLTNMLRKLHYSTIDPAKTEAAASKDKSRDKKKDEQASESEYT